VQPSVKLKREKDAFTEKKTFQITRRQKTHPLEAYRSQPSGMPALSSAQIASPHLSKLWVLQGQTGDNPGGDLKKGQGAKGHGARVEDVI